MKRNLLAILIVFCGSMTLSYGQGTVTSASALLEKLFGRLRENIPSEKKLVVNDSIIALIDSYAGSDTLFSHRFSNLRYLGQVTSPDSLVKIITWNLILADGKNNYFCYFIKRDKKEGPGTITKLRGSYREKPALTDTIYTPSGWYGALYYDIRPFDLNGSRKYILLGIDYGSSFITRKLIDVVCFGPGNEITFGLKCFTDGKTTGQRVVFEYSAKAVMSLKFESDKLIVFDHLSPFSPQYLDNKQFYGPDFSFDSFNLENGYWRYKGDIDIKNK